MPRTRSEDHEARKQQILDAALEIFASKGFIQATNAEIARAAGIKSPGLIYHYFRDKRDLLDQVMQQRVPVLRLVRAQDELFKLSPRDLLTTFATSFLSALETSQAAAFIRVMFGEAVRNAEFAAMYGQLGPLKAVGFLSAYLEKQMNLGRLRRADPAAAARCFLGPLIVYALMREVFRLPDSEGLSGEKMAETSVEIFLNGLQVNEGG